MSPSGLIYLVDDSADVRLHLGDLLRRLGYSVETFADAEAFLKARRPASPAVILMDMRMPGLSGLQAQSRLLAQGWSTPVVFISGESHLHEGIQAMKQGAVDFLCKPFGREELVVAVDRALEVDRARQVSQRRRAEIERRLAELSRREREIFFLMLQGHPNREIAEITDVQAGTIKKHRAAVLEKMQVSGTAELLELCQGLDLTDLRESPSSP